MHARRCATAACVALLVSCGSPSAPTRQPDLRGSWGGTPAAWSWGDSYTYAPQLSRSSVCGGTLEVASQNEGSFDGSYVIACSSGARSAGSLLDGHIDADGNLSFRLRAVEGWDPGLLPGWFTAPCAVAADSGAYEGRLVNGAMSIQRIQTFDCPQGRVYVTSAFRGAHS